MSVLIVAVVIAWIAILLLGLAVGGLLAQVRALESRLVGQRVDIPGVAVRFADDADLPPGAFSVAFAASDCDVCHDAITSLLEQLDGGTLVIVSDKELTAWPIPPAGARVMIDAGAAERSGVPAVPWFAAVDDEGRTVESFALGNPPSIKRAAQLAQHNSPLAERPSSANQ